MNALVENSKPSVEGFELNWRYVRTIVFVIDLVFGLIFGLLFGMVIIVEDISSKVLFSFPGVQTGLLIILNIVLWPILKSQKNGV